MKHFQFPTRRTFLSWAALGLGGLTQACQASPRSTSQNAATGAIELTVMIGAQEIPTWKPVIDQWEAQQSQIRIKIIEGPTATNLVEDLYTSAFLLGKSPYDLIFMDIVWVPKFAAAGWLLDLTDLLSAADLADFLPADVAGGRYAGGLYRLPARTDAGLLFYRQDLLAAAGYQPPETTLELLKIAQDLQKQQKVRWGYLWQGKQYEGLPAMFVEILAGHGGFWVDSETRTVGLDRPEALNALQFLAETLAAKISPPGVTTYQEEETRRMFQNGDALFLRNWPYVWPLANATDSPVRGKIALKPMVHAPGFASAGCLGGWGWGIAKSTRHPEAAWQAVQHLCSSIAQKQMTLAYGYLPTRRSLYQDPEILQKYPFFPSMLTVLEAAVLRPPIAQYAQASDILQRYLSAALSKRLSPEQALQAAATETRRLLGTGP
ncbi:ABC transporter substrate-binding protein [Alkalinema sp. FACHB-956]|uniref:ABC transporter substrate-binding protein n=1 Tax=Alkalinema sp. FACHB-956 TaxID=2692768 RepID=UPI0016880871|nr:ABC transporter substrate-binding protein [Alkalinema sp. FACHB-956]MBD2329041.1 ABC transporter substrate-binding protein [Alkalinema sp. FACHB-956]